MRQPGPLPVRLIGTAAGIVRYPVLDTARQARHAAPFLPRFQEPRA